MAFRWRPWILVVGLCGAPIARGDSQQAERSLEGSLLHRRLDLRGLQHVPASAVCDRDHELEARTAARARFAGRHPLLQFGRGLSALLLSNPCNPTGKLLQGDELLRWVRLTRELDCALLIDEFYSHYIWSGRPRALPVESAARYIEDVDREQVVRAGKQPPEPAGVGTSSRPGVSSSMVATCTTSGRGSVRAKRRYVMPGWSVSSAAAGCGR